ncbi:MULTISPECIES: hypothetical protein [Priestia]|uniref:Uncharacterized protein n=1 Tax=Priestia veravalensis TaxID=1414648 RepID=A0A0V8J7K7_9BACI|nr:MULTISPECIES: hypothetical protein [Priestia]KSU82792.1 hypothetical protein AS180_21250 [Priestia veravalensis]SCC60507.1 hypothetical protein GA0061087_11391 [Priestia flexa]
MSFIGLVMLFVLFLILVFIVVGVLFHRRNTQNTPSLLRVGVLLLQLLLIVLFFTEITARFNELFFDILWWVTVVSGLIVGIRNVKNNVIISMLNIFLSVLLAIFMLLLMFITSM